MFCTLFFRYLCFDIIATLTGALLLWIFFKTAKKEFRLSLETVRVECVHVRVGVCTVLKKSR